MWKVKITVVPVVIGTLKAVTPNRENGSSRFQEHHIFTSQYITVYSVFMKMPAVKIYMQSLSQKVLMAQTNTYRPLL